MNHMKVFPSRAHAVGWGLNSSYAELKGINEIKKGEVRGRWRGVVAILIFSH